MKKYIASLFFVFAFSSTGLYGQNDIAYENAYQTLKNMLEDKEPYSFKKAVFTVENAYYNGAIDTLIFEKSIKDLVAVSKNITRIRKLKNYNYKDKETVLKYASLFSVMRDSVPFKFGDKDYTYIPFRYDFDDIWGNEDWGKMLVTKLLETGSGNCHSLPYLYKILAEEIGVTAHLALAPNHIYIKHRSEGNGWYNTELTSGYFPTDAWIMASGYVHLDAVRNGVYMKALNNKESIALLLVDLAQGYKKKAIYNDNTFILKCINTTLQFYPNNINALLLKQEIYKNQLDKIAEQRDKQIEEIFDTPECLQIFQSLTEQTQKIHDLGYRQMPQEMYLNWLISLKEEKEKYHNKKYN